MKDWLRQVRCHWGVIFELNVRETDCRGFEDIKISRETASSPNCLNDELFDYNEKSYFKVYTPVNLQE